MVFPVLYNLKEFNDAPANKNGQDSKGKAEACIHGKSEDLLILQQHKGIVRERRKGGETAKQSDG